MTGVQTCALPISWTAVPNVKTALHIVNSAGMPTNAGILVDSLHVGRSYTTLEDIKRIPRALLHYAQICDAEAGTHFSTEEMIHTARCARELPGQGTINLKGIFDSLPNDLPISVEVVNFKQEDKFSTVEWAEMCLASSKLFVT